MNSAFKKAFKIYKYLVSIFIVVFLIYFLIDDYDLVINSSYSTMTLLYLLALVVFYAFIFSCWFWLITSITIILDFYTKETR